MTISKPIQNPSDIRILLLESIHPVAQKALENAGFRVDLLHTSLAGEDLAKRLREYQVLGIRSKTQVTGDVIKANKQLLSIGCFCIGTDQVDLVGANSSGIPVFNAPYSNTRSVAELIICYMVALSRKLGDRNTETHRGEWVKSAAGCKEVRGKTLGIVGYGHIGSQVSVLAEAMGLRVYYYDIVKKMPIGNAKSVDALDELLSKSDFVSLHVPDTTETRGMIGERQLSKMRKGSYLLNASRGLVVELGALSQFLKSHHLAGAAVDVFPREPKHNEEPFVSELQQIPNVILTPHIGGSTEEAQEAIGHEVAESFLRYLGVGSTTGAVNFPNVELPMTEGVNRIMNVHENVPGVLGNINGIVSKNSANIRAQYLATDSKIGYLVMDMEHGDMAKVCDEIDQLSTSIRTRVSKR